MGVKGLIAAVAAVTMSATPVLAAPANSLSLKGATAVKRVGASAGQKDELAGGGLIVGLLAAAAVVAGVVVVASEDDDDSN